MLALSNSHPLDCLRVGKPWERRRERRDLLGIILIRVLHLAVGTDKLLFCRAVLPRVLEGRKARWSRCWAGWLTIRRAFIFFEGKVNESAVSPGQAEGSNLRKSSETQNHLGPETIMAVESASWVGKGLSLPWPTYMFGGTSPNGCCHRTEIWT